MTVDFLKPAHITQAQQLSSGARNSCGSEMPRHLRPVKQLGRGAYGSVHLCDDTIRGTQVAVKHVKNAARHGKSILREVHLLSRLRHENLLHLVDFPAIASPDFEDVYLVLPYMPSDLHKVIQSKQTLSEKHVQVIVCQIFRALAHLHGAGVAHRDLKPANILLTADCRLKICDFGLARGDMHMNAGAEASDSEEPQEVCGVFTEYVVTRWYRAPEVMLLPKQYSTALDIWAVGCILCEILGRRAIFPGKNHVDMICRCARTLGTPRDEDLTWLPKSSDAYKFLRHVCPQSDGVPLSSLYPTASTDCLNLARSLLEWDPSRRPTASEAQAHDYMKAYLPRHPPKQPEPFDWGFDDFRPTLHEVKHRLYRESLRFQAAAAEREREARQQHQQQEQQHQHDQQQQQQQYHHQEARSHEQQPRPRRSSTYQDIAAAFASEGSRSKPELPPPMAGKISSARRPSNPPPAKLRSTTPPVRGSQSVYAAPEQMAVEKYPPAQFRSSCLVR